MTSGKCLFKAGETENEMRTRRTMKGKKTEKSLKNKRKNSDKSISGKPRLYSLINAFYPYTIYTLFSSYLAFEV
jgi:hypothetical protein